MYEEKLGTFSHLLAKLVTLVTNKILTLMPKLSFGLDTPCSKIVSALKFLTLMTDPVIFYINALKRLWPTGPPLLICFWDLQSSLASVCQENEKYFEQKKSYVLPICAWRKRETFFLASNLFISLELRRKGEKAILGKLKPW